MSPRINIEDSIYREDSFIELVLMFGSKAMAIGVMVEAFTLAQEFYLTEDNDRLIPFKEWDRFKYKDELTKSGAVIVNEKGVYVRGSKEQFAWLVQRSEAGKVLTPAKIEQLAKARKKKQQNLSERTLNEDCTDANGSEPLTLPLSPSLPLSLTHSHSQNIAKPKISKKPTADSADAELKKLASQVIARYCELWKEKYKTNISMSGKWAGNAKTLIKDHGLNRSIELVEAFMAMNDSWFIQNRHSFELILTKLAAIAHYAGTGVQITKAQVNQLDKTQANKSAAEGAAEYFRKQGEK